MAVVYRHIGLDNNEVFYVGIGKDRKRPYSKSGRNQHWKNYINKHGYYVDILSDSVDYELAKEVEISLVSYYGRRDLGTGRLVNMTDGGEGSIGRFVSQETRLKMSKVHKGKKLSKKQISLIKNRGLVSVDQLSMDGSFIKTFKSVNDAAIYVDGFPTHITRVCKGGRNSSRGFKWRYHE